MRATVKNLLVAAAVIAAAGIGAVITSKIFGTICMFKAITGIPCPGCGMTRAWRAILHGDFADALYWHPLFTLAPVLVGAIAFYASPKNLHVRKITEIALIAICAVFIAVWIVRLANGWR